MREIKFRAWIKTGGMDREGCMVNLNSEEIDECIDDGEPVMQYTGLKDKNGKEVYEGDVLNWMDLIFPITVNDYHGYRFMFGKDELCKEYCVNGEVIGNIYENPELLE